jgi:hypothetical protein
MIMAGLIILVESQTIFQQNATGHSSQLWKLPIPTALTSSEKAEFFPSDYIYPTWLSIKKKLYADHRYLHYTPILISSNLKIVNNTFCIEHSQPKSMNVALEIFDCRGRKIYSSPATLQNKRVHQASLLINQRKLKIGSGLYTCKIDVSSNQFRERRCLKTNLIR